MHYDPTSFINDAMALVLSMLVSSVPFAVLLPPSTPWLRNRLLADLRRQVVLASRAHPSRVRSHFESGARDLMFSDQRARAERSGGAARHVALAVFGARNRQCGDRSRAAKWPRCRPTRATRKRRRGALHCARCATR